MSEFADALRKKIQALEDEKAVLTEALDDKIAVLTEMLASETGGSALPVVAAKRKPGRPKKVVAPVSEAPAKKKAATAEDVALFEEAQSALLSRGGGTDPEQAAKIAKRFAPTPRAERNYGSNVHPLVRGEMKRKRRGIPEAFGPETEETE